MTTISRRVVIFCLLSLVALSCECTNRRLNSLNTLRNVYSLRGNLSVHSLYLLHWFASTIDIDNNNNVRLNFDPRIDFRSHSYGNYEGLLAQVSPRYRYYTVGNINPPEVQTCPVPRRFPRNVLNPRVVDPPSLGRNRDRIIVEAQPGGSREVGRMYLTQHFRLEDNLGSGYDPDLTFELSRDLLQQLRLFSINNHINNLTSLWDLRDQFNQNIDDTQLNDLINMWGINQARLELLLRTVAPQRMNLVSRRKVRDTAGNTTGEWQSAELQNTHSDVTTGGDGKAETVWRNVTQDQINDRAAEALFNNQTDQEEESGIYKQMNSSEGSFDTSALLKEGPQVRFYTTPQQILRASVPIDGYAQLQLYADDGKACFRIFVKKGCDQWRSDFYSSWVGLYESPDKSNTAYMFRQWQWVTHFDLGLHYDDYETLYYCTSTTMTLDLQARFFIKGFEEDARAPAWLWLWLENAWLLH